MFLVACGTSGSLPCGLDNGNCLPPNTTMDLLSKYPGVMDLKGRAQKRLPKFVWEYLDSGTGVEATKARNRAALDQIGFMPSILHGAQTADTGITFLGQHYPLPFGIAPIGMSGLIWPEAEMLLARAAATARLPYTLSTVASRNPEDMAQHLGENAWFQMYPPKKEDIRRDLLDRARAAGFTTLVLTVDVPVASRRERQTRSGLTQPPKLTPRLLAQIAMRPAWAMGADFVMLGRAFHFALAALGGDGPAHVIDILAQDMAANMGQLGAADLTQMPTPFTLKPL